MASAVIYATRTVSGNQPAIRRVGEKASQTFLLGVPVQLSGGFVQEWDGVTIANGIAGFSKEIASNLTASGVAKTPGTRADVPFEPQAVTIFRGSPLNLGDIGFESAVDDSIFFGQVGPAQTTVQADIGAQYGMTKDADGHWFVDKNKVGANAVVKVVELDFNDTSRGVKFVVLYGSQQLSG